MLATHVRQATVRTRLAAVMLVLSTGAALAAVDGAAAPERGAAVLQLRAVITTTTWVGDFCPPGSFETRPTLRCFRRDGVGLVPGLGRVAGSYIHAHESVRCAEPEIEVIGATFQFTVQGKGTIDIAMDEIASCRPEVEITRPSRSFTITGGSGSYTGATGGGTVTQLSNIPANPAIGTDTWVGTLEVPGLEFDLTPPSLTGAKSKTVRVPRGQRSARVRFTLSARDGVDGLVPVACTPRSGSRFKIGVTRVTCTATDGSGNSATAQFAVNVRPRR